MRQEATALVGMPLPEDKMHTLTFASQFYQIIST